MQLHLARINVRKEVFAQNECQREGTETRKSKNGKHESTVSERPLERGKVPLLEVVEMMVEPFMNPPDKTAPQRGIASLEKRHFLRQKDVHHRWQ